MEGTLERRDRTGEDAEVFGGPRAAHDAERLALVDLLDRVLGGGVVISGDVTLSIAGVDLVRVSLRALVASVASVAASSGVQEAR